MFWPIKGWNGWNCFRPTLIQNQNLWWIKALGTKVNHKLSGLANANENEMGEIFMDQSESKTRILAEIS